MYVERAYQVAAKHAELHPDPTTEGGQFHRASGNRLQVNEPQIRNKMELEYLISIL
ncbi:hypothetical protein KIP88_34960 [Bradyrhizobium sp. SRL28]|uniref:hypothetical protein n=1 Tax=Bradyrhizobium sp. SRL28 TaxID=2836178 RepID=UPI001BDE9CB7|nr:hypothetical protein [Bradyrhizobium sp. SRL28]MBT1515683.1 hypothetical protein [Bradyrhizobium sp. SRL28]